MALTTEETEIRGMRVVTTKLSARKAGPMALQLGKIVAPAVGAWEGSKDISQEDIGALAPALAQMIGALDDYGFDNLVTHLFQTTFAVDNSGDKPRKHELNSTRGVDAAFEDDLAALIECMVFVFKVNFAGFFSADSTKSLFARMGRPELSEALNSNSQTSSESNG